MYTIGQLAKRFGLSRSTLLYYDSIGLLPPASRSTGNYRLYSQQTLERMQQIQTYRAAGLPLDSIRSLLSFSTSASVVLERHLQDVNQEINRLREQQQVIIKLLNQPESFSESRHVTKAQWVAMLKAAGLDEAGMHKWHCEFEKRSPKAHQDFLESLGIVPDEIERIRQGSRQSS
ncbi:MerR family transcriptional regulator [Thiolinea disciformis]|uniref:MerR family transcriptional regulator n=1 Tax=Thiolinea disciformis TaxID=125614 RepID=UPI00035E620F|nr:MerR family transcriptional regulator [Thiolinea disciformis]